MIAFHSLSEGVVAFFLFGFSLWSLPAVKLSNFLLRQTLSLFDEEEAEEATYGGGAGADQEQDAASGVLRVVGRMVAIGRAQEIDKIAGEEADADADGPVEGCAHSLPLLGHDL